MSDFGSTFDDHNAEPVDGQGAHRAQSTEDHDSSAAVTAALAAAEAARVAAEAANTAAAAAAEVAGLDPSTPRGRGRTAGGQGTGAKASGLLHNLPGYSAVSGLSSTGSEAFHQVRTQIGEVAPSSVEELMDAVKTSFYAAVGAQDVAIERLQKAVGDAKELNDKEELKRISESYLALASNVVESLSSRGNDVVSRLRSRVAGESSGADSDDETVDIETERPASGSDTGH